MRLLACGAMVSQSVSSSLAATPLAAPPTVTSSGSAQPLVARLPGVSSRRNSPPPPLVATQPAPTQPTPSRSYDAVQTSATHHEQAEMPVPPEPIGGGSQPRGEGMTLEEVTSIALANSPVIMEARNLAIAARGRALQASLYPNPTMGHASPQLAGNQSQYNAYVIQDLVTKNKIGLDTAAAERAAIAAEFALVRARFDVLTMVRQRFYTALAMQERIVVLERMVNIAQTALDVGQRLLKAEVGTRGDVLLLQIELSKSEADLKNFHALAETSRRQLSAATGLLNLQIDRVDGDLKQALPEFDLLSVQQGVLTRNADVARANVEVARNQFVLRRAQVEPFPNVNMMGGYQNQQPAALAPTVQGIYQLQIVVPLWNRNQGNIRAAQANISASVAQYNRVRLELANLSAETLGRYFVALQLVERYEKEILPSAVQVQSITAQLYQQGQVDFLRYLAAQRALLDANLTYITAQQDRWTSAAEVASLLQSEQFP